MPHNNSQDIEASGSRGVDTMATDCDDLKSSPLPAMQMLMLCIASVIEPIQFGIVFPFMYLAFLI